METDFLQKATDISLFDRYPGHLLWEFWQLELGFLFSKLQNPPQCTNENTFTVILILKSPRVSRATIFNCNEWLPKSDLWCYLKPCSAHIDLPKQVSRLQKNHTLIHSSLELEVKSFRVCSFTVADVWLSNTRGTLWMVSLVLFGLAFGECLRPPLL